ncbi:hypothetical protein P7C71_g1164, partial [Lecanoromycetidae sp. Uapishka_2]
MREAIHSSILEVWPNCAGDPVIRRPDCVVDISQKGAFNISTITLSGAYEYFIRALLPLHRLLQDETDLSKYETQDISDLLWVGSAGGRSEAAIVCRRGKPDARYILKGVTYKTYLEYAEEIEDRMEVCYHEIRTIRALPRHDNIIAPASIFAVVRNVKDGDQEDLVCGVLYPLLENFSLSTRIDQQLMPTTTTREPRRNLARWCFQMVSAIAHTHFEAHTYHMDLKPPNILLDDEENIIVIDWEQSGAPRSTRAPEVDGTWDVQEVNNEDVPHLIYTKYKGPPRQNMAHGRPKWNIFPIWRQHCPRALEKAEVYSLGRTMWMLLQLVGSEELEGNEKLAMYWDERSKDIPQHWKELVGRCLEPDPNTRVGLRELEAFWREEKQKSESSED